MIKIYCKYNKFIYHTKNICFSQIVFFDFTVERRAGDT